MRKQVKCHILNADLVLSILQNTLTSRRIKGHLEEELYQKVLVG